MDSQLEIQDEEVELPNRDPLNFPPPPPISSPPRRRLRNLGPAAIRCGVLSALLLCRSSDRRKTLVSEPIRGEYWYEEPSRCIEIIRFCAGAVPGGVGIFTRNNWSDFWIGCSWWWTPIPPSFLATGKGLISRLPGALSEL